MASAKRKKKKKPVRKSKDVRHIEGLTKANDFLLLRFTGLEYLANHLLERYVSILTPEEAEEVAVAIVKGAKPHHRVFLTELIGRSNGYGITAQKRRGDQNLQ